jgi:hypothetical protein
MPNLAKKWLLVVVLLLLASLSSLFLISPKPRPPIEIILDPKDIQTEIDGTMVIPYPAGPLYRNFLGIYRSSTPISPFIQIHNPGRLRQPAASYFGTFGTNQGCIFIYPPETGADWTIEIEANHTRQIVIGRFRHVLSSRTYLWKSPQFYRANRASSEFKKAAPSTSPRTKLYTPRGLLDYLEVATFRNSEPNHEFPHGQTAPAFQIQFTDGRTEWFPADQLTNYFILPADF